VKAPSWPSFSDLQQAYERLRSKDVPVTCGDLARFIPWARVDARLGEILIGYLSDHFFRLDPFTLRSANQTHSQPQVLAVLIEFCRLNLKSLGRENRRDFDLWAGIVIQDVKPAPAQMFLIGSHLIDHQRLIKQAQRSLKAYLRWGFLGDQSLLSHKIVAPRSLTLIDPTFRKMTLETLINNRVGEITVNDYIEACGGRVHRRTAERDFIECPRLKKIGFTRNRRYRIVKVIA
jgi:hypothetical protein